MLANYIRRFKATSRKTAGVRKSPNNNKKQPPMNPDNWQDVQSHRAGYQCAMEENETRAAVLTEANIEDVAEEFGMIYSPNPFVFQEPTPSTKLENIRQLSGTLRNGSRYAVVWEDENHVFSCITENENPKYNDALLELLDDPQSGRQNYTFKCNTKFGQGALYAKKDLGADMPVGVDSGALWMERRWNKMNKGNNDQMVGLFVTDIPRAFLHNIAKKFNGQYRGDGLLFDCSTHGNELRFLQDPTWFCRAHAPPNPNVGVYVVFCDEPPYVQLVYFTQSKVRADDELTIHYGDQTWDDIFNLQLAGNARMARGYQKRWIKLEEALRNANQPIPEIPSRAKKNQVVFFNTGNDAIFSIGPEGEASQAHIDTERDDPVDATLQKIQRKYSNPLSHIRKRDLADWFQPDTWPRDVGRTETLIIPTNRLKSLNLRLSNEDKEAWAAHPVRLAEIAQGRGADRYLQLAKIMSPYHPVNLFASPGLDHGRAAVAKCDISEEFPIAQYSGELMYNSDKELDEVSAYTYELVDMKKRGYRGKRLFVNAERKGGLSRFINDIWTPTGYPKKAANCYMRVVIDQETSLPMAVVYSQAKIKKGEEVLIEYGEQYWNVMFRGMLGRLTDYSLDASQRCDKLLEYVETGNIVLDRIPGIREREEEDGKPRAKENPQSAPDGHESNPDDEESTKEIEQGDERISLEISDNTGPSSNAARKQKQSTGAKGTKFLVTGTTKVNPPARVPSRAKVAKEPSMKARAAPMRSAAKRTRTAKRRKTSHSPTSGATEDPRAPSPSLLVRSQAMLSLARGQPSNIPSPPELN